MDRTNTSFDKLVNSLRSPAAYGDGTQTVEVVETHISCVFLTDRFAYKLKKPVQFDFLDFSTVEARRRACYDELRLNRRLTTDVYLDVLAVHEDQHNDYSLAGDGSIVDWVVKMRRLNAADTLAHRLTSQSLADKELVRVITRLDAFYRAADRPAIEAAAYHGDLAHHVCANRAALLSAYPLDNTLVRRVHQRQLTFLALRSRLFAERVAGGCIVDGHGDLRPEHIFLAQPPQIIDCIEFSAEYRRLDVADEICFLSMECDRLGASVVARQIISRCQERFADHWPPRLIDFYRAYRACVRAKVAALRSGQLSEHRPDDALAGARRYLDLADTYSAGLSVRLVVLVGGLMGSGKSTLASQLADELGIDVLSTDAIRRELFGGKPAAARYGEGLYRLENRTRVYDELFRRAGEALDDGLSVVLDGTFLSTELKACAVEMATLRGAEVAFLRCTCPDDVARARIENRRRGGDSSSDARPELFDLQRQEEQPDPPGLHRLDIDTTQPIAEQVAQSCALLARFAAGRD